MNFKLFGYGKKGKKIIFDSHEDFPRQILEKDWIPSLIRKFISRSAEWYINKTFKKFDVILSVTPHIAENLKKASDKVFLLTNYPLLEDKFNDFTKDDYVSRDNQLCYAGTVYRSSMQENISQSIHNIDDIKYTIVGTFNPVYKNDIEKYLRSPKIEVLDKVPREDLLKMYNKMTIGIAIFDYSPNLGYKIGSLGVNKIFEYMYYGLPIICTDFELWKEIVDKHKCGIYVNPHNIDEITKAVLFLIANKEKAFEMGQNGRKAILNEYNWDRQGEIYLKIIKALVK